MMDFVETLIGSFEVGLAMTRIGVVTYASDALVRFELNKYDNAAEIIEFVDTMRRQHGGTQTGDALKEAREHTFQKEHGARDEVIQVAIVITDGVSANRKQTIAEAKLVRDEGIKVRIC
jgi:Mg-chelatase subunit ChlD